jgi:hypothetical protein
LGHGTEGVVASSLRQPLHLEGMQTDTHGAHGETGGLMTSVYAPNGEHHFGLDNGHMGHGPVEFGGHEQGSFGHMEPLTATDHGPITPPTHDFQPADYSHAVAQTEVHHFAMHG